LATLALTGAAVYAALIAVFDRPGAAMLLKLVRAMLPGRLPPLRIGNGCFAVRPCGTVGRSTAHLAPDPRCHRGGFPASYAKNLRQLEIIMW